MIDPELATSLCAAARLEVSMLTILASRPA